MITEAKPVLEQRGFARGVAELEEREKGLLKIGFSLFFERVLKLRTIASQPSKNWMDYRDSEINFVNISAEDVKVFTPDERSNFGIIYDTLDFYGSMGLAVFNIRDDKSDKHKGIYRQGAEVLVQSSFGEAFRKKIVLHLAYGYTQREGSCWENNKSISYTGFGLSDTFNRPDIKLLLAANTVAELYSQRVNK